MTRNIPYRIKRIRKTDCLPVVKFVINLRKELFPMLNHEQWPDDMLHFHEWYVDRIDSAFFAAISEHGSILGTIGYLPYDHRFKQLENLYEKQKTAELVKCYVDRNYRRLGIGSALFHAAVESMHSAGYEICYLHTHPFLPGGIPFWKAKGFTERLAENDPVWKTLHMDKRL